MDKTNHTLIEPKTGELGFGCRCGQRFPTLKAAEAHAADQNLIEENEAKAKTEREARAEKPQAPDRAVYDVTTDEPKGPLPSTPPPAMQETLSAPEPPTERKSDEGDSKPEPGPEERLQPSAVQPSSTPTASEAPQALSPSNLPLDLENLSLNQINFIGQTMAKSGMFPDVKDGAKALVKILAGKEIGVTPFQAMTNIHIIQGKATMGANLMAAKVKGSSKYDYRVTKLTNKVCKIMFKQRTATVSQWEELGEFTYSVEDAERAGLVKDGSSWVKYPQNMLFARAISSGVRLYCPDVFNGNLVYVPEEMGAQVDEDGEPVGKAA
jgi:hypothetical protein